eukprot:CAMPEP_0177756646 /NCGR_PEP_ID=MMETSP0491_2-20121128/3222_1 /TAXON_ID=63592 /ORGANISM="Tetraselmis chuii, Strain PLY429" /LENGTH=116 /DNA_ID=CAMNT_0019272247 /DNA_START=450 /DNA_END=800 /DNA_ORIENTATION=-
MPTCFRGAVLSISASSSYMLGWSPKFSGFSWGKVPEVRESAFVDATTDCSHPQSTSSAVLAEQQKPRRSAPDSAVIVGRLFSFRVSPETISPDIVSVKLCFFGVGAQKRAMMGVQD